MENTSYVFTKDDPNGLYVNGQYFYRKDEGDSSTSCTSSSSTASNGGTPSHKCKGNFYAENSNEMQIVQQQQHQQSVVKQVTNPFLESPTNNNYNTATAGHLVNNNRASENNNADLVTTDTASDHSNDNAVNHAARSDENELNSNKEEIVVTANLNTSNNNNISSYFTNSTASFDAKSNFNSLNVSQPAAPVSHNLPSSMNPFLIGSNVQQQQQQNPVPPYNSNNIINHTSTLPASTQYPQLFNNFNQTNSSTSGLSQLNDRNTVSGNTKTINQGNAVPFAQSQFGYYNNNVISSNSTSQHHNKTAAVENSNWYGRQILTNNSVPQQTISHSSSSESVPNQFTIGNSNSTSSAMNKSFQLPNTVPVSSSSSAQPISHLQQQLPNEIPADIANSFIPSNTLRYIRSSLPSSTQPQSRPQPQSQPPAVSNIGANSYGSSSSSSTTVSQSTVNATFPGTAVVSGGTSWQNNSSIPPSIPLAPQKQQQQPPLPPMPQSVINQRLSLGYNTGQNTPPPLQAPGYSNPAYYVQQQQQHVQSPPRGQNYPIPPSQGQGNNYPSSQTNKPIGSNYQTNMLTAAQSYQHNNMSAQNSTNVRHPFNVQNYPTVSQQSGPPLLTQPQRQQHQQQQQLQHPPYAGYGNYPGGQPHSGSNVNALANNLSGMSVTQGYNKLRGLECVDLLRCMDILPKERVVPPPVCLPGEHLQDCNCNPDILRCTLNKIPETRSLLEKSRLPFGILLHPFRDLQQLSVINCSSIVRCRSCRTYINPFVFFIDSRHWRCNLCFRTNEVPDDFLFNPISKVYDDPTKRPEVRSATIEYIAPSEYMLRPPQPAVYLFILDVSRIATQTGYLRIVCEMIIDNLENLPGDARTSVGFITFDSTVHYYSLSQGLTRPQQLIIPDIEDMFLPLPDDLIVNLSENKEMVVNLLTELPLKFKESYICNSALGAALQAAYKLMSPTGGRVSVFQTCLPNYGPGSLKNREDPSQRNSDQMAALKPASDFYKKLGLECNGQHVAIDLFVLNSQYIDLVTIAGICQVSGGCMYHFPLFNAKNAIDVERFEKSFRRYLARKIGFEAVMRLRCTRGLSIHSFHGNFFVRTTDLLALPNVNPDAGFGMQVSIDENLSDLQNVTLQAALLYTSSKGERRIRVHTLCLPVSSDLQEILTSADQQCIAGLLSKMAVDRILQSSLSDAREAFINAAYDPLNVYKMIVSPGSHGSLLAPENMQLLPLYILALLKNNAFRTGSVRLDDRVFAMYQMKCLPLDQLIRLIYPELYEIHNIVSHPKFESDQLAPNIPLMRLSAERIQSNGIYLLDDGELMIVLIGQAISPQTCANFFGTTQCSSISENEELPIIETEENKLLHAFVNNLQSLKPHSIPVQMIKYSSPTRVKFFEKLIEDKTEFGVSYYEFLQTIRARMN